MQNILIYLIAGVVIFLNGCALHKPDVQQGNILTQEMLAQLHTGLSKKQVKFVLGTPIIQDPFHPNRWDYVYWYKAQDKSPVRQRLTVIFSKGMVSRLETQGITLPPPAAATEGKTP